jgi:hypothetical protein
MTFITVPSICLEEIVAGSNLRTRDNPISLIILLTDLSSPPFFSAALF